MSVSLHNEQNATYEDRFHANHPMIVAFWEVFEELSDQDKKAFLCEYIKWFWVLKICATSKPLTSYVQMI